MIRAILYEDNENLRSSLTSLLQWQHDVELITAMPDARTVLADIEQFQPDVVLMDIDMPDVNGIEALKQVRSVHEQLPVVMLTVFEDNDHIFNAICAGASGYLLKKNFDQIVPAIKDVLNGGAPMTGVIARKVLALFPRPARSKQEEETLLSAREQELLQLLIKGYSYKMIADELHIALETVRSHIKKIYRKLQVNSATEAIYKVSRDKLP
ncbi:MAG TPA: response regulator transcription factor [Lacibacter sp.]|nr:response regulator transcription factor [Lacibacter sp.]HMO88545.1 response regulator transcription factor [Lacibacter sp.]